MQVLVFCLPDESGERIGFSLTILLTEIVFLTVVQESIPKASSSFVSVLIHKQFIDISISLFILLGVVLASICYDTENKKEPKKTEEPKKTGEKPGKLIVQTKGKELSSKFLTIFFPMMS